MEQQIQDLIDSIKKEGIQEAKNESDKILSEAKQTAADIVNKAKVERERLLESAKKEIEISRSGSEAAIKQAARDVSLQLKKNIESSFTEILKSAVSDSLHGEFLEKIINTVINSEVNSKNIYLELSNKDFKALGSRLAGVYAKEIKNGMEIKSNPSLSSGFRISEKNGSSYIDFSDEEVTALIFPYLSSTLKEIIG